MLQPRAIRSTPAPAVAPTCRGCVPFRFPAARKETPPSMKGRMRRPFQNVYFVSTGNSHVTTLIGPTPDPVSSSRKIPSASSDQFGRKRHSIVGPPTMVRSPGFGSVPKKPPGSTRVRKSLVIAVPTTTPKERFCAADVTQIQNKVRNRGVRMRSRRVARRAPARFGGIGTVCALICVPKTHR